MVKLSIIFLNGSTGTSSIGTLNTAEKQKKMKIKKIPPALGTRHQHAKRQTPTEVRKKSKAADCCYTLFSNMLAMHYWSISSCFLIALKINVSLSYSFQPLGRRLDFKGPKIVSGHRHGNYLLRRFSSEDHSAIGVDEEFVAFPNCDIDGPGVVQTCMDALLKNSEPYDNAGLEVCFNFSSDRCRAAQGGTLEEFIRFADNPTFGSMVDAQSWEIVSTGPIIEGTQTRGAMQTQLVGVIPKDGRPRRFLWTMQKERRPPRQSCWLVHECIFVDNAYSLTV